MNSCITIEIRRNYIASILGSTETSVNLYQIVQRYIQEDTVVPTYISYKKLANIL
jgi:hypothetical protein